MREVDLNDLLITAILLTAANYLFVLYATSPEIEGPFKLFSWFRIRVGLQPVVITDVDTGAEEIVDYAHEGQFLAQLLSCHRCLSPWSAAAVIGLSWLVGLTEPGWTDLILWLAVAGATIFLFE